MKVYAVHLIDSRCTEKNHMDIPNLEVFETAKVNSRVGSGYQAETAPQLKEAIILRPQQIYVSQHDHCQISPCLRFANQFQTNNLTVHFICVSLPALRSCHFCASEPYRSITRLWPSSPLLDLDLSVLVYIRRKNTIMLFFPFSILSMLATSNDFPPADHNKTLA